MVDPDDKKAFAAVIGGLAVSTGKEADSILLKAYWVGLEDLPIDAVQRAAMKALRESKFMPSVAELRELAGVASSQDQALKAWGVFQEAVRKHGYHRSVLFEDPVITATVRNLGGWMRVCDLPEDEFSKWLRKDFISTYEALSHGDVGLSGEGHLIGFFESQNRKNGYEHDQPKLISSGGKSVPKLKADRPSGLPRVEFKTVSGKD